MPRSKSGRVGRGSEPIGMREGSVERMDQPGLRAVIFRQPEALRHAVARAIPKCGPRAEVGVQIPAAKTVNRLLGIADQE